MLSRERHISPLVAIDLWVRAGAREEQEGEDGCAHFLEHTLFKGSVSRNVGQADIDIENLGATLTAATGPDYAHFYTTVATAYVPQALNILADIIRNATLPPVEVERERGVILDELSSHDSNPTAYLIDTLYKRALPMQAYGRSPGGTAESIRLRGRDTLAAFYARWYRPERCTLVLAGDISPAQAQELARAAFADWQPGQEAIKGKGIRDKGKEGSVPILPSVGVKETSGFSSHLVGLAFPGPVARDYGMAAAAQIVAEILGDSQEGGRLHTTAFVSAHVTARYTPRLDGSLWMLTSQELTLRPVMDRATQFRALLADLRVHPPTPYELQAARGRILARMQAETETNAGLAYAVGYADVVGGEAPETLRARLQSTTNSDIQQFVTRFLLSQPGLMVYLSPSPTASERRP